MRILITGGAGKIGHFLMRHLAKQHSVRVLDKAAVEESRAAMLQRI